MTDIPVSASKGYHVLLGSGLLDHAGAQLRAIGAGETVAVLCDDTVRELYADRLCSSLRQAGFRVVVYSFAPGEASKSLSVYGELVAFLGESRLSRTDTVAALGGGVVGDLAGFAAATWQRGVSLVQIPTTLLAAVDSSVGGKTAVNLPTGKNQVGCFYQPRLVLCDPDVLSTLPERELLCGCGEVIKYGVLYDAGLFDSLGRVPLCDRLEDVIAACIRLKSRAVAQDEFDRAERQMLNLGHTIGHAAEQCSGYTLAHGCAVAIGMAVITRAAAARGICSQSTLHRLLELLQKYGLPTEPEADAESLFRAALSDKKIADGQLHLIVPEDIGRCRMETIPAEELRGWLADGGVL